ncbi:retrovirus-related pol polyprotein from transposon TNT 1-94 [Tanacetum coccineum]
MISATDQVHFYPDTKAKRSPKPITPQFESGLSCTDSDPETSSGGDRNAKDWHPYKSRQFGNQRTMTVVGARETVGSQRAMLLANETRDEEIDEQELEAHYKYMDKIRMVSPERILFYCHNGDYLKRIQGSFSGFKVVKEEKDIDKRLKWTNNFAPEREETMTLENESRSKLNKDKVKPYDYTNQNSLYEIFKGPSLEYLYQLVVNTSKEVRKTMWEKTRISKPSRVNNTKTVIKPGMRDLPPTPQTQTRTPQLPHASRNTNPHMSKSSGVIHTTSVSRPQLKCYQVKDKIVQLILFIVDSGCTKHMTGNLKLLCNFVEKFLGTVHFGNDQFAPILGYGDLKQGNVTIKRVYYVEGLNHNLFSVGQFCDADLEVAFRKSTCFVRDLQGNDLLTGSRGSDLYTISLQETTSSTPICFMAKASPTQACKEKGSSFKEKAVPSSKGRLNLLHMDLCGPMRVDETLEVLKDFLTMIQHNLQAQVITVRTDRGIEFLNKTLHAYFKEEGIEHQTSTPQTPKQNDIVERRNPVATACYTQNRSIIISTHGKTAYHIINDRKPSIKHLHIFGCICYITRDGENLDKMKEKGDPCVMVGYSTQSKGYRVYNKRTRLIVESIHIKFDEIKEMMSDHNSSDLAPQRQEMSVENVSSRLIPQGQKASDYDNSDPMPPRQKVVPIAKNTDSS